MFLFVRFLAAALFLSAAWPATLAVSTYFKDGFTRTAIAADSQGNIIVGGSALIDPKAQTTGAVVAKINATASQFLYLTYLDSAASDQISSIAVDGAGNAYVTGTTSNPNFPTVGGGTLGKAPASSSDVRPFVVKLSPQGAVIFSVLLGNSVAATARGIALTPQGQILVSGVANASGFPATPGAYSIFDSTNHWYLMEVDATASKVIFSATGIGGNSLTMDAAGNIYMAGSSLGTDYPTTPGAYQTALEQGYFCYPMCQIDYPGELQHITKVDAAASKLMYSTGLNDPKGAAGSTVNTGLTVDSAGNAYVTGTLLEGTFPLTVESTGSYTTFLAKLDPAGASLLFSIPAGGAGVALDASGKLYAGGYMSTYSPLFFMFGPSPVAAPQTPPVFSWLPAQCLPNNITGNSDAYAIQVDPATGDLLDGQWIDGSETTAAGMALAGGKVWVTGSAAAPDVPFTPGAISPFAPTVLGPGFLQGGWLAAADFSAGPNSGPAIGCVLDAANLMHAGGVTGFEWISIFGTNLGPAEGVVASGGGATSLGGVSATFDGDNPALVLYASSTQINLAVPLPLPSRDVTPWPTATVMQLNVNGVTLSRQFPYLLNNLSLFAYLQDGIAICNDAAAFDQGYLPVATNADGSANSCSNPAQAGSTVSFYMHGVGAQQLGFPPISVIRDLTATLGDCSAQVVKAALMGDFVYRVDVAVPASLMACAGITSANGKFLVAANFNYNGTPAGPFVLPVPDRNNLNYSPVKAMPLVVYLQQ